MAAGSMNGSGLERNCEPQAREVAKGAFESDGVVLGGANGGPSMRWALAHMIEETGRHAGHLDILRELADGTTGR